MTPRRFWLLIAVGGGLLLAVLGGTQLASQTPAADGNRANPGRFTMATGPLGEAGELAVFVIDSRTQRLLAYTIEASPPRMKLLGARDISYDVQLSHYNNLPPLPETIRDQLNGTPGGAAD